MEIVEEKKGNWLVVGIKGRVDSAQADTLQKKLLALAESHGTILIDCLNMEYISSAGLGAFLLLLKSIQKRGGRLLLCGLSPRIREVFDISGFSKIFTIVASCEEAFKTSPA